MFDTTLTSDFAAQQLFIHRSENVEEGETLVPRVRHHALGEQTERRTKSKRGRRAAAVAKTSENAEKSETLLSPVRHDADGNPEADAPITAATSTVHTSAAETSAETASSAEPGTDSIADLPDDAHGAAAITRTRQSLALCALSCGETAVDAAEKAGVDRRTVHRWMNLDWFQAELNGTQRMLSSDLKSFLTSMAKDAVAVIEESLEEQDALAAVELLKRTQVLTGNSTVGMDRVHTEMLPYSSLPHSRLSYYEPLSEQNSSETSIHAAGLKAKRPVPFGSSSLPKGFGWPSDEKPKHVDKLFPDKMRVEILQDLERFDELEPAAQQTIMAIMQGGSIHTAAKAAGVPDFTVRRWLQSDPVFCQVLRACRLEYELQVRTRLLNLCRVATQVVHFAIMQKNRRVSFALLRGLGMLR